MNLNMTAAERVCTFEQAQQLFALLNKEIKDYSNFEWFYQGEKILLREVPVIEVGKSAIPAFTAFDLERFINWETVAYSRITGKWLYYTNDYTTCNDNEAIARAQILIHQRTY